MARFLRRKHVTEEQPEEQSFWQVPARYNFSRDVVEAYAADPLRPALTFVDREGVIDRRTFADIAIDAGRWAGLLRSRGLEPGDRVLVVVGLNRTWHGVMLGALKAGVVAIPCPVSLDVAEIHRRARDAEARVAVVEADRASEVWQSDAPLTIVVVDEVEPELREIPPIQPTHDTAAADEALILYTSGTTGAPKGTILTHASTWAARVPAEHWLDARTGDLVWCTVGQSWALSVWSILFYPWSRGAESVLHDAEFDPEQRFDLLQRLGVTVLCQSPTEYRLLTEAPWISRFDLGRLRHAVSSGERLELETITAFRKVFDVTIHDGYGQAENALLVANARGTAVKPGSMGLPLPGHEVAVVNEAGTELPADAEGDLVLRGRPPTLFTGYIEGTAETADVFRGDWYLTGDRATRDADGYLWFTGRGAPLREVAADRARAAEAREAEILALENARVDDTTGETARLDDAVGRKKQRAAADAKRAEGEAAARAERRADLERRTAAALAADEIRREDERRAVEAEAQAEERARLEAEAAKREDERREQERRDAEAALIEERARRQAEAEAAERARLEAEAAEAARLEAEAAQREREQREQERRDAEAALAEAALIEERARRQAEAEAAERARLEAEAAEAARLEAEAAQREREQREQERRDAEAALAEAALIEERARRQAEAEAAERARLEAEAAEAARLEAEAAQREREQREQERRDAEAALAEERGRREQEEADARGAAVAAAAAAETEDAAPSAAPALSGRAARKEQQRIRKEEERARKDEERRRKEEERARKDAERKQQEEERAAAERRKREEAAEQKAAAERARQAEQRRKEEEKQRREEEKAAQELERREAEARQREARAAAETQRAEEARQKAAEEERRKEEERRRKAAEKERREAERQRKPPAPGETVAEPGDESLDEDRPNAELIARLRAYGLRQPDDGADE